jgi:hypothetical protein
MAQIASLKSVAYQHTRTSGTLRAWLCDYLIFFRSRDLMRHEDFLSFLGRLQDP